MCLCVCLSAVCGQAGLEECLNNAAQCITAICHICPVGDMVSVEVMPSNYFPACAERGIEMANEVVAKLRKNGKDG